MAAITPELFRFFRELKRNNEREWFLNNKARYEEVVRDPLLEFVSDFGPHLHKIHPRLVADPRPVGGALFRIQRDVRFSPDKTPYKTSAGLRFPHEEGRDVHAPGYYLHLEPGAVFAAAGIWHPDPPTLGKVRDAIAADPKGWKRTLSALGSRCPLEGDALKKPPRGYDPEHPFIEDLKRKDFITSISFTERQACASGFMKKFQDACVTMRPLVAFLSRAVGVTW
jgi:uncharacterized protein (TIGR02453 family)